jgi:hypothetical protein
MSCPLPGALPWLLPHRRPSLLPGTGIEHAFLQEWSVHGVMETLTRGARAWHR